MSLESGCILNPQRLKCAGHNRVGIQVLSQAISHGAMRDSAERDPPPRCHPGTREKVTKDIVRWIEEPNPCSNVLWVNGRAGVGKSALMQKIAELGIVYFGGCFFFRRGTPGCNVKDHLFSTLAYQLAMNVDGMLEAVDRAVMQDFFPSQDVRCCPVETTHHPTNPTPPNPSSPYYHHHRRTRRMRNFQFTARYPHIDRSTHNGPHCRDSVHHRESPRTSD